MRIKKPEEVWYRYEDKSYCSVYQTEWGDYQYYGNIVKIVCKELPVIKHTPKGVWLRYRTKERWVSLTSNKQFACPTKELAMKSFMARKHRQKRLLTSQMDRVEEAIRLGDRMSLGEA